MNRLFRVLVGLLLICVSHICAQAQTVVKHFTIEDGLPSNEVYFVHQDKNGYFWFCTDRGISRYNGYEFTNFTTADGLTNNVVFKCFEDWDGNLWFTCMDGSVTIFDQKRRVFEPFEHSKWLKSKYIPQHWVQNIGFLKNSRKVVFFMFTNDIIDSIYIQSENGLHTISKKKFFEDYTSYFENMLVLNKWSFFRNTHLLAVYNASSLGIRPDKIQRLIEENASKYVNIPSFHAIDGDLFACTATGSYNLSDTTSSSKLISVPSSSILKDKEGYYWISTLNSGVYLLSNNGIQSFSFADKIKLNEKLISGKTFHSKLVLGVEPFKVIRVNLNSMEIESEGSCNSVSKVSTFFYNTDSSIIYYDDWVLSYSNDKYTQSRKSIDILDLEKDSVTMLGIKYNIADAHPILNGSVFEGLHIMGTRNGSSIVEWLVNCDKYHSSVLRGNHGIIRNYYFGSDYAYIGTNSGLLKVYEDERGSEILDFGGGFANMSVSDLDTVYGVTIVSTKGQGVIGVKEDSIMFKLDVSDKLLSQTVNTLYIDRKDSTIWFGTNSGVSIYTYTIRNNSLQIKWTRNIRRIDGLYSAFINDLEIVDDKMVVISDNGLTLLPLRETKPKEHWPNVSLLGYVNGNATYHDKDLEFSYNDNNFEFRYEAILTRKAKGSYQYRLVSGNDSVKWSLTDERSISVNNIASGTYAFQVRARVADGDWGPISAYTFTITPRFIDRWWVRTIILLLIIAGLYLFFQVRLKRLNEKNKLELDNQELELQIAKLESASLRGQMNPHFIFNVLNSIQKLILTEEKDDANKLLARFSKLVRSSLQFSRLDFIPLTEEIAFLTNYMNIEAQRFPGRFTYSIDVAEELLQDANVPPLLIQPLIENAIKHAFVEDGGTIALKIALKDEEHLKIEVVDNGIGIDKSSKLKKNSLGTTIIRDRLKLIENEGGKGSLTLESHNKNTGKGTIATLIIPYT